MRLKTLYFVRFRNRVDNDSVVFCITGNCEADAIMLGASQINATIRGEYDLETCEPMCKTRDTVNMEPV